MQKHGANAGETLGAELSAEKPGRVQVEKDPEVVAEMNRTAENDAVRADEARSHTGQMIARFKEFYGFRFDTDMARKLRLSDGSAIGNWRRRDTIDLLLIAEICPEINLDWLIWGRGVPQHGFFSDGAPEQAVHGSTSSISRENILHLVNEALERYLRAEQEVLQPPQQLPE